MHSAAIRLGSLVGLAGEVVVLLLDCSQSQHHIAVEIARFAGMERQPVAPKSQLLEYEAGNTAGLSVEVPKSAVGFGVATGNDRRHYSVAAGAKCQQGNVQIL